MSRRLLPLVAIAVTAAGCGGPSGGAAAEPGERAERRIERELSTWAGERLLTSAFVASHVRTTCPDADPSPRSSYECTITTTGRTGADATLPATWDPERDEPRAPVPVLLDTEWLRDHAAAYLPEASITSCDGPQVRAVTAATTVDCEVVEGAAAVRRGVRFEVSAAGAIRVAG